MEGFIQELSKRNNELYYENIELRNQIRELERDVANLSSDNDKLRDGWDDANEELAAISRHVYAFLMSLARTEGALKKDSPWGPLESTIGQLSQIDNLVAGICQDRDQARWDLNEAKQMLSKAMSIVEAARPFLLLKNNQFDAVNFLGAKRRLNRALSLFDEARKEKP